MKLDLIDLRCALIIDLVIESDKLDPKSACSLVYSPSWGSEIVGEYTEVSPDLTRMFLESLILRIQNEKL